MKPNKIFSLAALFAVAALVSTAFVSSRLFNKKVKDENKGFAVVELFTSEGCSSCPPADELVARIEKESVNKPVYILALHVDYWNRLGWKDVFSDAAYSKRQQDYAGYLHLQSVYTPQIVVNGKTEFVGSEENTLRNAIRNSLEKAPSARLFLNVRKENQDRLALSYNMEGTDKNTVLLVAIVQKQAQTKVERGENGGRTLAHVQIVRKLQQVALEGNSGQTNITLPTGFDRQNWEVIGLLQNTSTGAVTGAAKAKFDNDTIAGEKSSK